MDNWLIVSDGTALAPIEKQLTRYMPDVHVQLFPISQTRAVLRGHLVGAIVQRYPNIPLHVMMRGLGIDRWSPIADTDSVTLLAHRDGDNLPPRRRARTRPAPAAAAAAPAGIVADPHLHQVKLPQAWSLMGWPQPIAWGTVVAGHIDTGYTTHPALGFGPTQPPPPWLDAARGETFFAHPSAPELGDLSGPGKGLDNGLGISAGHGTRIGGTICGHAPLEATGPFYGAAPRLPVVPVRITDVVYISHAELQFAQAVHYLLDQSVSVINVSLGAKNFWVEAALKAAVNVAYEQGVIMVCAAGNFLNSVVMPACYPRTIAVAGVTDANQPWSGSSFGEEVDFSAPADQIRRAQVKGTNRFSYAGGGDGTSYAAALTTGAAALWLAYRGQEIKATYTQPWQTVEAFRFVARKSVQIPAGWQPDRGFGAGVLDVHALLQEPLPPATTLVQAAAA